MQELVSRGVDPYPPSFDLTHTVREIKASAGSGSVTEGAVSTAGRVMAIRRHGGMTFVDLHDDGHKLQCQLRVDVVGEEGYDFLRRYVERGDFLGVSGGLFYTRMGELTVQAEGFAILSKALYDLPGSWYGLSRVETRYRQRYLDLLLNPDVRDLFVIRGRVISGLRAFLDARGFLEVETPLIQEAYGGATARPFTTRVNYLDETRYLQISPELYLKRLTIGGYNRVYTICKNFRNEEIDVTHNPEFTMMECYQAYADYTDIMELTEAMVSTLATEIHGSTVVRYNGARIDLTPPWRRVTMYDALRETAGIDVSGMGDDEVQEFLMDCDPDNYGELMARRGYNRGLFIAQLFDRLCQGSMIQPTFVTDYPKETVPLCKAHRGDPDLIERFELFISGMEVANAYTELNDPVLQQRLFQEEMRRAEEGDAEAHPYDEGFLEALRYGMPPTGGLGVGIDRLVMLLTDNTSIKETILFPMMRRREGG